MTTAADDRAAALAADLQQAESLRRELAAERRHLIARICERSDQIRDGSSTSRAIAEMHRAEDDLRHLDGMIDRLDRRFALQLDPERQPPIFASSATERRSTNSGTKSRSGLPSNTA